jgi:hypothetical protein
VVGWVAHVLVQYRQGVTKVTAVIICIDTEVSELEGTAKMRLELDRCVSSENHKRTVSQGLHSCNESCPPTSLQDTDALEATEPGCFDAACVSRVGPR